MRQEYSNYTSEDHNVWSILFSRQMNALAANAASEFIEGVERVGFTEERIPDFNEVNARLLALTGWQLEVVPGIIPQKEFFELLAQKKFSATTWIRRMDQLDYLEEPDMFHDVFGHIPVLSNTDFCKFLRGLSDIALKNIDNPEAVEMLGRIYWFTIEFGLIRQDGVLKIYGAGIASSIGESKHSLSDKTEKIPFDVRTILETGFRNDVMQDKYFVIDSFAQLFRSLPLIESELAELIGKPLIK